MVPDEKKLTLDEELAWQQVLRSVEGASRADLFRVEPGEYPAPAKEVKEALEPVPKPRPPRPAPSGLPDLSVIIPVLKDEEALVPLCVDLEDTLASYGKTCEVILVDRGGPSGPRAEVEYLVRENPGRIFSLRAESTASEENALELGFAHARADVLITMRADMRCDPRDILPMLHRIEEGFDIVSGWRIDESRPKALRALDRVSNGIRSRLAGISLRDHSTPFRVYRSSAVRDRHLVGGLYPWAPGPVPVEGLRTCEMRTAYHPHLFGRKERDPRPWMTGALDALTIAYLRRFGQRPERLVAGVSLGVGGMGLAAWVGAAWFGSLTLLAAGGILLGLAATSLVASLSRVHLIHALTHTARDIARTSETQGEPQDDLLFDE